MRFVKFTLIALIPVALIFLINNRYLIAQLFSMKSEKVSFETVDQKRIVANAFEVNNPKGWLLLIHMMPATKESWDAFAFAAQKKGYESVAIDLRGHGESEDGHEGYKNFSDEEHRASIQDVEAAWEFLRGRGAVPEKSEELAASIGSNLG